MKKLFLWLIIFLFIVGFNSIAAEYLSKDIMMIGNADLGGETNAIKGK